MVRRRGKSSPTLSDVARRAGVSLATASRAINGSTTRTVGKDLARRVRQAADDLGYAPDANAQAMARGATQTIGVVVHDLTDPYFAAIADELAKTAGEHQLFMTLATTGNNIDALGDVIASLDSMRVRAIILVGARWEDRNLSDTLESSASRYTKHGGRLVAIGMGLTGVDSVSVDNASGAAALAEHLYTLGYRTPLVLVGPPGHSTAIARSSGFIRELEKHGVNVPPTHRIPSEFTRSGGRAAMQSALDAGLSFDVIVAMSDMMALGALHEARRAGLQIPTDAGITGFGDVGPLIDVQPGLTTVHVPAPHLARLALDLALGGPADGSGSVVVGVSPVIRDSTPPRNL